MTFTIKLLMGVLLLLGLAGCASTNLTAPCKNFGKYCHKTPINQGNHQTK